MFRSWLSEIESFIMRGNQETETENAPSQDSETSIPDSFDPSLRMSELEMRSQSPSSSTNELEIFLKIA